MNKNVMSWTQDLWEEADLDPDSRREYVEMSLRDHNVGQRRIRFHVISVERTHRRRYPFSPQWRVKLIASTSAIKKITGNWGEGALYTVNGKRKRVKSY